MTLKGVSTAAVSGASEMIMKGDSGSGDEDGICAHMLRAFAVTMVNMQLRKFIALTASHAPTLNSN